MLVLHHLGISQSERIVFLLEELQLPYKLVKHTRSPILSPDSLQNVPGNHTGKSPFLEDPDNNLTLSESQAITDYILARHAPSSSLAAKPTDAYFADYLYWKDYSNSTLQPAMLTSMFLAAAKLAPEVQIQQFADIRLKAALQHLDDRLKDHKWLAGDVFTAADTMSVYPVTTQRYFGPQVSLAEYPNIVRWLKDIGERPAYQRAMEKGDPQMALLLGADTPGNLMEAGGTDSDMWKKK